MTTTTLPGVRGYRRLTLSNTFTKAIADRMLLALIVGGGLGAMSLSMGPMFVALEDTIIEMMAQFPESILSIAGGADMATPAGWYTGEMYSIMAPFAVIFVAISSATRAFGGEMENKTIGLVMATPTRRTRLAINKAAAMVIHVAVAATIMALGTWIGVAVSGIDITLGNVLAITLMLILIASATGGLAMLISVITGRGTVAMLLAALVAVFAYVWSSFVPLADAIADLAWLSPWHHYIATDPMGSGVDWASAALLAIVAIIPISIGVYLFKRRDIAA
jgi:ABC-2 type transport system permease protein